MSLEWNAPNQAPQINVSLFGTGNHCSIGIYYFQFAVTSKRFPVEYSSYPPMASQNVLGSFPSRIGSTSLKTS